jgi:Fe-S-cluster containining protein
MAERAIKDDQRRVYFDCNKCPAFCCSVYERVEVKARDLNRLARHFGVTPQQAQRRYTMQREGQRVLKRVEDAIFRETCMFLDQKTRRCTIYHARPAVCRGYPARTRCAYYDLLQFERKQQGRDDVVPVVDIIFRETGEEVVGGEDGPEVVEEWGRDVTQEAGGAKKDPDAVEVRDLADRAAPLLNPPRRRPRGG